MSESREIFPEQEPTWKQCEEKFSEYLRFWCSKDFEKLDAEYNAMLDEYVKANLLQE